MQEHRTALTDGQSAEFLGSAMRQLVLIQNQVGPVRAVEWASEQSALMRERFLEALTRPTGASVVHGNHSLRDIPVWRTLTIGGYSREELPKIVEREGFRVSDEARYCMARPEFVTSPAPYTIRLGRVRVGDLGFTDWTRTPKLFGRLAEHFDECPPEAGPHLRRIYRDQPTGEWLPVFQKTIAGSDGVPYVFGLGARSDGLCLAADAARSGCVWGPEYEIVVRLRE